ncbi:DUF3987 domain-containing protein [Halomonas sp. EGI 63088]|uniref:DUF3987 domain-containing protein n=1 Tax=Halomonas flagellata TaxID=2920385 RepID=A0ABS9RYZ4_9GAMM|nr:YfjI family protein [Halomonas flagellata]MCH4565058.1 DUF3987 domain-containing protein [Halomonas flagellata]
MTQFYQDEGPSNSPFAQENGFEGDWPAYDEHSRFESMTQEVAQHVEVAPEMARTAALSAMAMACQGVVDAAYPNNHVVPTSLYVLTIAETGERKTALENWMFKPIRDYQKAKKMESQNELEEYNRQLKNWQSDDRALTKLRTKAFVDGESTEEIELRQAGLHKNKPKPPKNHQMLYENITPIALAYGLYENIPMACLLSSEAGNIMEGKAMEDLPMLNSLWSGSPLDVTRRTSPSFTLDDPRLTVALMAQPKVINRFLEKRGEEAMDNGFLSRFLVIKPRSMVGIREGKGRAVNPGVMERFHSRATELLEESFEILEKSDRQRKVLEFTPSAKELWNEIHSGIEKAMAEHGHYEHARGHGNKLMDNITRVAAIIHTFEGYEGEIDTPLLEYSWHLCKRHSYHFMQHIAGDPEIVINTNQLVREIRRLGDESIDETYHIKKSHLRRNVRSKELRESEHLDAAINLLKQLGHIEEKRKGNLSFSETIIGITDPKFKNGIDYYVKEVARFDSQEKFIEGRGAYMGFILNNDHDKK